MNTLYADGHLTWRLADNISVQSHHSANPNMIHSNFLQVYWAF